MMDENKNPHFLFRVEGFSIRGMPFGNRHEKKKMNECRV
jgi:hypothetical protein